uniref:Lipase n=1 Tax=Acrobeloides nanus TaxID=290746 RepID=A0A914CIS4_9BILA
MMMFIVNTLIFSLFLTCSSGTLTKDFQHWLKKYDYSKDDFNRADLGHSGSYGGKKHSFDKIHHQPVIFIHGNSDTALFNESLGELASGWTNSIEYFLTKGYRPNELYATTWGDGNQLMALTRTHDCATLKRLRHFVEAVLSYTNATKIDIIAHSMGVTLGRKIISGGIVATSEEKCHLGESLHSKIDTFLGLSGANYGLCSCESLTNYPVCNKMNGFWPGDTCAKETELCSENDVSIPCQDKLQDKTIYAKYLMKLNKNTKPIANHVYSAWSIDDEVLSSPSSETSISTALIPKSTGHKIYSKLTHMQTKEQTAEDQYNMVVHHFI